MGDDVLDFAQFQDTLDVDAATDINLGANLLSIDLDSTGDFAIRDGTTNVVLFEDDSTVDVTFPAAGFLTIDASTTANTTTTGVLDINVGAGNAAVDGINVALTSNDGATAGTDQEAIVTTLTANDADADVFGLVINAAATANAAAGSYEAAIKIDNAENTAGSMTDAIIVTATTDTATTDAVDASDAEIVNALNIGDNTIIGTTGVIDLTDFDVSADGKVTLAGDASAIDLDIVSPNTTADVVNISAASLTTARAIDVPDLDVITTGRGLNIASGSEAISSGELLTLALTSSGSANTAKTGALSSITASRTDTRVSGTTADDYDLLSLSRTNVQNGTGGTTTAAGSVLKVENIATQTAGTLTDTVNALEIVQDVDSTGWPLIVTDGGDTNVMRLSDSDGTCDHNPEAGSETVSCSSDERLKTNIRDAAVVLPSLMKLRIRDYTVLASGDERTGVIAQEVQGIAPELVTEGDDGYFMVEQIGSWELVKAIQELKTENDEQAQTLTQLLPDTSAFAETDAKLSALASRVDEVAAGLEELKQGSVAGIADPSPTPFQTSSAPSGTASPDGTGSGTGLTSDIFSEELTFENVLHFQNNVEIIGELEVHSDVTLYANLIVDTVHIAQALNVHGDTTLFGNLDVQGELSVSAQQAGRAVIPRGGKEVEVIYTKPFMNEPVIQVSASDSSIPYRISEQSKNSFKLFLPDLSQEEITFSWVALGTKEVTPTLGEALDSDKNGVLDIDEPEETPSNLPLSGEEQTLSLPDKGGSEGGFTPELTSSPTPTPSEVPAPQPLADLVPLLQPAL